MSFIVGCCWGLPANPDLETDVLVSLVLFIAVSSFAFSFGTELKTFLNADGYWGPILTRVFSTWVWTACSSEEACFEGIIRRETNRGTIRYIKSHPIEKKKLMWHLKQILYCISTLIIWCAFKKLFKNSCGFDDDFSLFCRTCFAPVLNILHNIWTKVVDTVKSKDLIWWHKQHLTHL